MDWKLFSATVLAGTVAGSAVANLALGFEPNRGVMSATVSAVVVLFLLRRAGFLK